MRPANQIAVSTANAVRTGAQSEPVRTSCTGGRELDQFARNQINNIFTRLQGIFPTWRAAYPTEQELNEAKKNWTLALISSGIHSIEQIKRGMDKARLSESPFFPTSGQFIAWCVELPTAKSLGMPDATDAYREAIDNCHDISRWNPSHPAVYEAGRTVTWHRLRRCDIASGKKEFLDAYKRLVQRVAAGEEIGGNLLTSDSKNSKEGKPSRADVEIGRAMAPSKLSELKRLLRSDLGTQGKGRSVPQKRTLRFELQDRRYDR